MGGSGPDAVEDSGPDTPDDVGTDTPDDADENTPDAGPVCGDGEVDDTEECDDGNDVDDDGCANDCTSNLARLCDKCGDDDDCFGDQSLCVDLPYGSFCAPGCTLDGDECPDTHACEEIVDADSGDVIGAGCVPTDDYACGNCGDGALYDGEECDDGNIESGDGCTPMCAIEPRCGDGVVNNVIAEECDGANEIDGDACSNLCETTEAFIRNPTENATVCGRGDCTTLGEIGGVRCYSVGD